MNLARIAPIGLSLSLTLTVAAGASAAPISLFVFGDSLSDTGNIAIATAGALPGSPPYDPMRFTNRAPVAIEVIAASLGLPVLPALAGGTNFAFGGVRTGPGGPVPDLISQVGLFGAMVGAADPNALYFLFAGMNDIRDAAADPGNAVAIVGQATANFFAALDSLYGLGARTFFVPNVPNLGRTPEAIGGGTAAEATALSLMFNAGLASQLDSFSTLRPGAEVIRFDTFLFLESVLANPAAYGFTNTTAACLATPGCNPDEYVFWDGIHPTARTHELFGAAMAEAVPDSAVPEPSALLLVGVGLLGLVRRSRRS